MPSNRRGTWVGCAGLTIAGGLLTQYLGKYLGWRAVFLVNPPLIAVMLVLVPRLAADRPRPAAASKSTCPARRW